MYTAIHLQLKHVKTMMSPTIIKEHMTGKSPFCFSLAWYSAINGLRTKNFSKIIYMFSHVKNIIISA